MHSLTTTKDNTIKSWECKGKFQYFKLSEGRSVWLTLGMSGRFGINTELRYKHPRLRFVLQEPNAHEVTKVIYHDQRNFGTVHFCMDEATLATKLKGLGPDLLTDLTEELFLAAARNKRQKNPTNICTYRFHYYFAAIAQRLNAHYR
jgi:formamidopyrimidine-DNA glycosylase